MATTLNNDVIRESTVEHDGRLINVTLGADQKIKMKLKGMKSGDVEVDILALYHQLCGCEGETSEMESKKVNTYIRKEVGKYSQPDPKVAKTVLQDFRSQNVISGLDIETLVKFDTIVANLINSYES
jgi:hypothetical protein